MSTEVLLPERGSSLELRNALHEWDRVQSSILFQGSDMSPPLVTIAITTFRRPAYLVEAVGSALKQNSPVPYEIVVIDNDPESECLDHLLRFYPDLATRNFRYYRNEENIGMYGNVNRCIPLARGEWLSILHDDDLLAEDFISKTLAEVDRFPSADGIATEENILDERPPTGVMAAAARKMSLGYVLQLASAGPGGWRTLASRILDRFRAEIEKRHWLGRTSRRIRPRTFFMGPVLGNSSGFIFRTQVARDMGGFYPEEFPASDLCFFARFAARYHLRQLREQVCFYRVAENESLKLETAMKGLIWIHKLQQDLASVHVPRFFLRFAPAIMENWRTIYRSHWRFDIPKSELEQLLGMRLPEDRPRLVWQLRLLLGAL